MSKKTEWKCIGFDEHGYRKYGLVEAEDKPSLFWRAIAWWRGLTDYDKVDLCGLLALALVIIASFSYYGWNH